MRLLPCWLHVFLFEGDSFYLPGQELGTTNVWKDSVCEFDDIESRGQYLSALSDGCTKEEALYILTCAAETMQER